MIRLLARAIRNLLGRRQVEQDLEEELRAYEDLLVAEKIATGLPPDAARRAARVDHGGRAAVAEAVRDVRAGAWVEQLARDLRYAVRTLLRSPGFTTFTLLTFAVALGGLIVIFSLFNAVLLRPLPYPESDRLVTVLETDDDDLSGGFSIAAPNYQDWQHQNTVFERMALYEYQGYNLTDGAEPQRVGGLRVTGGVFDVLGVAPLLGRGLQPSDDSAGGGRVVVLSHRLWKSRYGGDSGVVGSSIQINREPALVVGVMPPGFAFPSALQDLWIPLRLNPEDQNRGSHSFWAIARLKGGVSVQQARAALRVIGDRLAAEYPATNAGETVNVFPMRDLWVQDVEETLRTLLVGVALVLLIASANITSLLVARGAARQREIAARMALGGSRWRIVRQLVTESIVLGLGGAAVGLALAAFGIRALVALFPPTLRNVPFRDLSAVSLEPIVIGVAIAVALLASIAAGLGSALAVLPTTLAPALRAGGARAGATRRNRKLTSVLVTIEVALAVVVLVGAGLLVASIRRVQRVAPGIDVRDVVALNIELPQADFYGAAVRPTFCADVAREVGALPGIASVSAVSHLPLSGANAGRSFVLGGAPDPGPGHLPSASYGVVCPGYLRTMGIPLLAGRDFSDADRADAPPVMIINQSLRDRWFKNEDPVGRRFKLGRFDSPTPWVTIVGVAGDVRHSGLQRAPAPYFYAPYSQAAWPGMWVIARSGTPIENITVFRGALARAAPGEPIGEATSMEQVLEASLGHLRFPMTLFVVFAIAAVGLAALGCFGVMSQTVVERRRELAIRMALGARALEVYRMVIAQAMTPVAWGLAAGIAGAIGGTRVLRQLLYDITPTDPLTLGLGAAILGAATIAVCVLPARRAATVDPANVLREE